MENTQLTLHDADKVSCVGLPVPPVDLARTDDADDAEKDFLLPIEHPSDIPIPEYQNGVILLKSLPGATGVVYLDAPETSRQRCIITPTDDASPGAGGAARFP